MTPKLKFIVYSVLLFMSIFLVVLLTALFIASCFGLVDNTIALSYWSALGLFSWGVLGHISYLELKKMQVKIE